MIFAIYRHLSVTLSYVSGRCVRKYARMTALDHDYLGTYVPVGPLVFSVKHNHGVRCTVYGEPQSKRS